MFCSFLQMSRQSAQQFLLGSQTRGPGRPVALSHRPPPPITLQTMASTDDVLQSNSRGGPRAIQPSMLVHVNLRTPSSSTAVQRTDTVGLQRVNPSRAKNEYVDTPSANNSSQKDPVVRQKVDILSNKSNNNHLDAITIQPTLKKETEEEDSCPVSITCSNCRKCKCGACTSPRHLPKVWIGKDKNKRVELSLECCVDICTCLCLVKCCFHNCFNYLDREEEDGYASDHPCGCCSQPHCCKRWTCMAGAALACPTLLLYPFCKLGLIACTGMYNCCTRRGCTCDQTQNNRLLESESSTNPST